MQDQFPTLLLSHQTDFISKKVYKVPHTLYIATNKCCKCNGWQPHIRWLILMRFSNGKRIFNIILR